MVKKRGCGRMRRENVASGRRDRNANINCEVHVDFGGGRQREKVAWWLVVVEDEEERGSGIRRGRVTLLGCSALSTTTETTALSDIDLENMRKNKISRMNFIESSIWKS